MLLSVTTDGVGAVLIAFTIVVLVVVVMVVVVVANAAAVPAAPAAAVCGCDRICWARDSRPAKLAPSDCMDSSS